MGDFVESVLMGVKNAWKQFEVSHLVLHTIHAESCYSCISFSSV